MISFNILILLKEFGVIMYDIVNDFLICSDFVKVFIKFKGDFILDILDCLFIIIFWMVLYYENFFK